MHFGEDANGIPLTGAFKHGQPAVWHFASPSSSFDASVAPGFRLSPEPAFLSLIEILTKPLKQSLLYDSNPLEQHLVISISFDQLAFGSDPVDRA
jgi:hypothetical protein